MPSSDDDVDESTLVTDAVSSQDSQRQQRSRANLHDAYTSSTSSASSNSSVSTSPSSTSATSQRQYKLPYSTDSVLYQQTRRYESTAYTSGSSSSSSTSSSSASTTSSSSSHTGSLDYDAEGVTEDMLELLSALQHSNDSADSQHVPSRLGSSSHSSSTYRTSKDDFLWNMLGLKSQDKERTNAGSGAGASSSSSSGSSTTSTTSTSVTSGRTGMQQQRSITRSILDLRKLHPNTAGGTAVKTGGIHLVNAPSFHTSPPPYAEPILPTNIETMEATVLAYNARLGDPMGVINKVVFDSLDMTNLKRMDTRDTNTLHARDLPPYYSLKGPYDDTLLFESRFESGNLRRVIQVYDAEYDLILKPDINTQGNTQWFFFSVSNARPGVRYRFNIINLAKPDSLYNYGMRPLRYSMKDAKESGLGWVRVGDDVCYYQNQIKRRTGQYYSFTFTVTFPYQEDTYYFSHCYPYTYSNLVDYLDELEADSAKKSRLRRKTLCTTLAGNSCDYLTITSFNCTPEELRARKGVVVTARVHPGETNASYMVKGLIDYLTGPTLEAKILRDNFIFKVVPMLNPDGVIVGNYRCSLAAVDLNRQWKDPNRKLYPTIYYTKMMIKRFMEDRQVLMCCDFHGHSRKFNVFMYGCENTHNSSLRLKERLFPRMLWHNGTVFSYADCNFKVQKSKESTARVVLWKELGLVNSFTLEASFCGANFGLYGNTHFNTYHLEEMGRVFCDSILDLCDPDQTKVETLHKELSFLHNRSGTGSTGAGGSSSSSSSSNLSIDAQQMRGFVSSDDEGESSSSSSSSNRRTSAGSKRSGKRRTSSASR